MNGSLINTVYATLKHGTRAKIVKQLVLKMGKNEQNLEHNIINM